MRIALALLLLAGLGLGHGESGRAAQAPNGGAGTQVFRTGGNSSPTGPRGGGATTIAETAKAHSWTTWWAYNREYILAKRLRGVVVSGTRIPTNDRVRRKELREGRLYDLMVRALDDKSHHVRAAAAIALGKFGNKDANRWLRRRSRFPGEGWYDVREASIYAMGILGLEDNRKTMEIIAGDKERYVKERGLALVSFGLDKSTDSADLLRWFLKYHRSSLRLRANQVPTLPEEEKRRMSAHMLGFAPGDHDDLLMNAAQGSRRWYTGVQGLAVTALGRRRSRDHIEPLFRLMRRRDTDRAVKQSIPIALGQILNRKDTSDVKRLARFVRDFRRFPVARNFTVMALADVGGPQAVDLLDDMLADNVFPDARDRAFVYLALGLIGHNSDKAKTRLMRAYEKTRVWSTRSVLAIALALARHKPAVNLTMKYLEKAPAVAASTGGGGRAGRNNRQSDDGPSDGGSHFKSYGSLALGLHGDKRAVPLVRKVIRKYHIPSVRQNAAIALALLLRQDAVRELVELMKEAGTVYTKAAAVTALGLMPEPTERAVDALVYAYRRDSFPDTVRAMAVIALGALADPRPVPLSAMLTRRYNYFIRCNALDEIARYL